MFEHKNLDGEWNRVVSASEAFLNNNDVLELRDNGTKDPKASSRRQYGVVGDRLVERCLPPETVGDIWSHDSAGLPWWTSVYNPPHAGIVASFNSHNGGKHRQILQKEQNVIGFAAEGEPVTFKDGMYSVVRKKDENTITASSLPALRKQYAEG